MGWLPLPRKRAVLSSQENSEGFILGVNWPPLEVEKGGGTLSLSLLNTAILAGKRCRLQDNRSNLRCQSPAPLLGNSSLPNEGSDHAVRLFFPERLALGIDIAPLIPIGPP